MGFEHSIMHRAINQKMFALGCERGVNCSSALPSACVLFRRASGWPGGSAAGKVKLQKQAHGTGLTLLPRDFLL